MTRLPDERVRVRTEALVAVEQVDHAHVLLGELEVEDAGVLLDALAVDGRSALLLLARASLPAATSTASAAKAR